MLQGNQLRGRQPQDGESAALADGRNDRTLPAWQPKDWKPDASVPLPSRFHDVLALKVLVSQPLYCFAQNVQSETRQSECASNLKNLFELIKTYDKKHGHLPSAAFYPQQPRASADSLRVLLEANSPSVFLRPTCSPDLQGFGLNYVWNQQLNGKQLAGIEDPSNTWLLMDLVGDI